MAAAFLVGRGATGGTAAGGATPAPGGVARGVRFRLEVVASDPFSDVAGSGSPDVSGLIAVWYPLRHV